MIELEGEIFSRGSKLVKKTCRLMYLTVLGVSVNEIHIRFGTTDSNLAISIGSILDTRPGTSNEYRHRIRQQMHIQIQIQIQIIMFLIFSISPLLNQK